ncbi:hypothetical protein Acr_00g0029260 [Actinidia rufa]|uniref:Uncharacterized protein n=1 Tax=Actinidia rufa TaxID=165716 RepID=A0A7J0DEG4_9ERIC|nr:hypothetical protein Acr_00g0029260 [Actinidia rufa]
MELNRAQLLVHNDTSMERFRTAYCIHADVGLRFSINSLLKEAMACCRLTFMQVSVNFVRTVLTMDMLIRILDKTFGAEDFFNVYTVVRPKREPGNPLYTGNHYLCLRNPNQPQTRLVDSNPSKDMFLDEFIWVLGGWEFRAGDDGLWSFPRYNDHLPNNFNDRVVELVKVSLPPLRIEGQTPWREAFSLESEEEEEAVSQLVLNRRRGRVVSVVKPKDPVPRIFILSSNYEHSDDLALVELAKAIMGVKLNSLDALLLDKHKGNELLVGTPKRPWRRIGEMSLGADSELWRPEFSACELGRQVTTADSARDHNTNVPLARAVMLPNDVAALSEETSKTMRSLLVMQHVQSVELKRAKKKVGNMESELNKPGSHWEKLIKLRPIWLPLNKPEMAVTQLQPSLKAKLMLPRPLPPSFRQWHVIEVRSEAFLEGWLTCPSELGVSKDNPVWSKATPTFEFPESPMHYLPMVLFGFDKEKYANRPEEDKEEAREKTAEEAMEGASRDPPLEL